MITIYDGKYIIEHSDESTVRLRKSLSKETQAMLGDFSIYDFLEDHKSDIKSVVKLTYVVEVVKF